MPLSYKDSDLDKCKTILDLKKLIQKIISFDNHALVIAFENALLHDNLRIDQLFDQRHPNTGDREND